MKKILVIDDQPEMLELLSESFKSIGMTCVTASSFLEAELMADNYYDGILIDYHLGEMKGDALITRFREINQNLKVALMTADHLERKSIKVFQKPFKTKELEEFFKGN